MSDDAKRFQSEGAQVTTATGDEGFTSLLGSDRVAKYSSRPTAFGTLDEASSALGLARALCTQPDLRDSIYELQQGLYKAMAELATPLENYDRVSFKVKAADVQRLQDISEQLKDEVLIGKEFIVPGDTACGAALDLARTIIRRGERLVARLYHEGEVTNSHLLQWLNRSSDVVFIMARWTESTHNS